MSVKRIPFTGKRKISHADVQITPQAMGAGYPKFAIFLSLKKYQFSQSAAVHVEAYRPSMLKWQRVKLGLVSDMSIAKILELPEFSPKDELLFRVKITDTGEKAGMLLGEVNGIRAVSDNKVESGRLPILSVDSCPLDGEIYRLKIFSTDDCPCLCFDEKLNRNTIARDPVFMGLVYPAVLRQIASHLIQLGCFTEENESDDEEWNHWTEGWKQYLLQFSSTAFPLGCKLDDAEDIQIIQGWVDELVARFARTLSLFKGYQYQEE